MMSQSKELILFIPGLSGGEPEKYLKKLTDGMADYCKGTGIPFKNIEDFTSTEGASKRQITIDVSDEVQKTIDIHEVYWSDLAQNLSTSSSSLKAIRGLSLIIFWMRSLPVWAAAIYSKYMFSSMLFTLFLMLFWYLGVFLAILTAIGTTPENVFTLKISESESVNFAPIMQSISDWAKALGGWYIFAVSSVLVTIFPVNSVVDTSYATQCYLLNRDNVFHKIRGRINSALYDAVRDPAYEKITVVGYSFGAVVAVEALASYTGKKELNLITLGSPLLLMAAKSTRVKDAIEQLQDNVQITYWSDFYSDQDWLCTKSPNTSANEKVYSQKITSSVPMDERLKGLSHQLYFGDWDVLKRFI